MTTEPRESYHDSTAPLGGPARIRYGQSWTVGVFVQPAESSPVSGRGADLERRSVELWGKAGGRWVPEAELDAAITDALRQTVEDLDAAIAELAAHRNRLAAELARRAETSEAETVHGLSTIASAIAARIIAERLAAGARIEIPSISVTLTRDGAEPTPPAQGDTPL